MDRDSNEDVWHEVADPGLPHLHDDVIHVTLLHVLVDVSQGAHVERGVGQHGVHPGHAEYGERDVEATDHEHVPVIRGALHQLVVGAVHHALCNVLVHEEEKRKGKAKHHSGQNHFQVKIWGIRNMENFVNLKDRKSLCWKDWRILWSILHNYLNLVKWRNLVRNYIFAIKIKALFLTQNIM